MTRTWIDFSVALALVALVRLVADKLTMVQVVALAERVGEVASRLAGRAIGPDDDLVRNTEKLFESASAYIPGARCLHSAAAAHVWLATRRVPSRVVVGFRKRDELEGHAWLEVVVDGVEHELFRTSDDGFREVWRRS